MPVRRRTLLAGAAGAAGAVLAACGGTATPAPASRATQPVTIQYWSIFGGPEGQRMTEIGAQYMKEAPLVTIEPQHGVGDMPTKMVAASAAGTPPDVVGVRHIYVGSFAERNVLVDLAPRELQQAGLRADDFDPTVWKASEYRGKRYSLPFDIHGYMLLSSASLVRELGVDPAKPPATWPAWQEWASRLTQGDRHGTVFDASGEALVRTFYGFIRQAGGHLFTADGTRAALNGAPGVETLTMMADVYQRSNMAAMTETPQALFEARRLASWVAGSFILNRLRTAGKFPFEDLQVSLYAQRDAARPAWWAQSHQLALTKSSAPEERKRSAAFDLVRWLIEHPLEWALAGQLPANRKVLASDEFQKSTDAVIRGLKAWEQHLGSAVFLPPLAKYQESPPAVSQALLRALRREVSPQAALAEAEVAINALLSA